MQDVDVQQKVERWPLKHITEDLNSEKQSLHHSQNKHLKKWVFVRQEQKNDFQKFLTLQ